MTTKAIVIWPVFLASLTGCVPGDLTLAPPPLGMVAVLPPENRTGDELLVTGGSLLERYAFGTARLTVPDLLAIELREALRARGVTVTPSATGRDGATLRLEVRRWETDRATQPAFVIVAVEASLIDVASERVLWHWRHPPRPIATPGAVTLGTAHEIAVRAVVAAMLATWPSNPTRTHTRTEWACRSRRAT